MVISQASGSLDDECQVVWSHPDNGRRVVWICESFRGLITGKSGGLMYTQPLTQAWKVHHKFKFSGHLEQEESLSP